MKIRVKHSIGGDRLIKKGQIIELSEADGQYWVKNGYGEVYHEDQFPEAEKIDPPADLTPVAEIIEAKQPDETEKAIKPRGKKRK